MDFKAPWVRGASSASMGCFAVIVTGSLVATRRKGLSRRVVAMVGRAPVSVSASVLTVNAVRFKLRQCRCLGILNSVFPNLAFVGAAGHVAKHVGPSAR